MEGLKDIMDRANKIDINLSNPFKPSNREKSFKKFKEDKINITIEEAYSEGYNQGFFHAEKLYNKKNQPIKG